LTEENKADSSTYEEVVRLIEDHDHESKNQLVELVKKKFVLSEKEITEILAKLEQEGTIHSTSIGVSMSQRLGSKFLSRIALWYWAVVALGLTTGIAAFTIPEDTYPLVIVRYFLGSFFVLFLPGYSLIKAVFPLKKELEIMERVALSLGLSLAIVPTTVFILNYTPWGIQPTPIIITLLAITLVLATTAMIRVNQATAKQAKTLS
jgi:hypothetical protein